MSSKEERTSAHNDESKSHHTGSSLSESTNRWSRYAGEIYRSQQPPLLSTVRVSRIEELTKEKMKGRDATYGFIFESAGTNATFKNNLEAFNEWRIIPRMLHDASERNVEVILFGRKLPSPLLLAPIGMQAFVDTEGEAATAHAAKSLGIPMIMSSAASRSIEDVAFANGTEGTRYFQIYWPKTDDITISLLSRAKNAGFSVLVVTVDAFGGNWRPYDMETAYNPFIHSIGCAIGFSDPVFMRRMGLKPWSFGQYVKFPYDPAAIEKRIKDGDKEAIMLRNVGLAWMEELYSGVYRTWDSLAFLRKHWQGPIVLKGILDVEDAETAIGYVDGIIVSNHGGRQVDGSIASLDALGNVCLSEKIRVAQRSGKFTVLFDSGIRTGMDIMKAIALGAQGVLLGRPYIQGLCLGGGAGVAEQIKAILCEFEVCLGLCGYKDVNSILGNRRLLTHKSKVPKL